MYINWTGEAQIYLDRLHKKHGPIVRITPGIIDIDEPSMIQTVFNTKGDWLKVSTSGQFRGLLADLRGRHHGTTRVVY